MELLDAHLCLAITGTRTPKPSRLRRYSFGAVADHGSGEHDSRGYEAIQPSWKIEPRRQLSVSRDLYGVVRATVAR